MGALGGSRPLISAQNTMGNKGNPSRKSRWSGRAVIKAEEKRRRRQEAKDAMREAQMERVEAQNEVSLVRRIPIRYD